MFKYMLQDVVDMPRIQITLTKDQLELIESFRGRMGNTQAEIVRNIILAWLAEKSFISDSVKKSHEKLYSNRR